MAYLNIVADHNDPFMSLLIISDWFLEHYNESTVLKGPLRSSDFNPMDLVSWDNWYHGNNL